jgi:hypothetical protein
MELGSNYELNIQSLKESEDNFLSFLSDFNTLFFDSGRSAIRALNGTLKKGIVLMPDYICRSVTDSFDSSFEIRFYKVKSDFSIDLPDLLNKLDENITVLYIMNYFGMIQRTEVLQELLEQKKKYGFTIVEDSTHSILSEANTIGDYCVCSLRKWLPIADGGVLYSRRELPFGSEKRWEKKKPSAVWDAMILKRWFIEQKVDSNALYRKIFAEEEDRLDGQTEVYEISELSKIMLRYYSVKDISERRRRNYRQIKKYFDSREETEICPVFMTDNFVPLSFPIYVKKRDELRKYLMEHRIYCAVHWPLEDPSLSNRSEHILSLPVDQRYGKEHMDYLCRVLDGFTGEE